MKNMGWVHYIVSPKLKVMFSIPRSVDQNMIEDVIGIMNKHSNEDILDFYDTTLKNVKIKDIGAAFKFYDDFAGRMQEYDFEVAIFYSILRGFDKELRIVSEMNELEIEKLVKEGFNIMSIGDD